MGELLSMYGYAQREVEAAAANMGDRSPASSRAEHHDEKERRSALLAALAVSHDWLHEHCERKSLAAQRIYDEAAEALRSGTLTSTVRARFVRDMASLVDEARREARLEAARRFAVETTAAFPKFAGIELAAGAEPDPDDVRTYVLDAIDIPIEMSHDDEQGSEADVLAAQAYRGTRLVNTAAVRSYEDARMAAAGDLRENYADGSYGFMVPDDEDDLAEGTSMALLMLRWSALIDEKTCLRCRERDGTTRLLVDPFSDGPPLHPHCRCVVSVWPYGW